MEVSYASKQQARMIASLLSGANQVMKHATAHSFNYVNTSVFQPMVSGMVQANHLIGLVNQTTQPALARQRVAALSGVVEKLADTLLSTYSFQPFELYLQLAHQLNAIVKLISALDVQLRKDATETPA